MRNSVLNSLLALMAFASCSPQILRGYEKIDDANLAREAFFPFFPTADSTVVFNMQIDYRSNHFSGILLVKNTDKDTYRAVFSTHFGMSVFDFLLSPEVFEVVSCLDDLNKKQVIGTLQEDFKTLLFLNIEEWNEVERFQNRGNSDLEILKKDKYYYLKNNDLQRTYRVFRPRFINAVDYGYDEFHDKFPAKIEIKHSKIGLTLNLDKIVK